MRKLLSANFSRLWRSKIFWALEGISAIAGAVFYILAIINTKNIGEDWYLLSGNYYFFVVLVYIGAIMAVFSSFYIGAEYSDGTIRNKLNVGCARNSIYLANLVVVVTAGVLFTITHMFTPLWMPVFHPPKVLILPVRKVSSIRWRLSASCA